MLSVTLSKQLGALFSLLPGHLLEASGNQVQAPTSRAFMLKFAVTLPPTLAFVMLPERTSLYIGEQAGTEFHQRCTENVMAGVTLSPSDRFKPSNSHFFPLSLSFLLTPYYSLCYLFQLICICHKNTHTQVFTKIKVRYVQRLCITTCHMLRNSFLSYNRLSNQYIHFVYSLSVYSICLPACVNMHTYTKNLCLDFQNCLCLA